MKSCTKCGELKPLDEFNKRASAQDGYMWHCRECHGAYRRAQYKDNPEYYREYVRKRREANPEKVRAYFNSEKVTKRYQEWRQNNSEKVSGYNSLWKRANSIKTAAHTAVRKATVSGELVRPVQCSSCSSTNRIEAHHEDYSKPLDVVWLCRKCHNKLHRKY